MLGRILAGPTKAVLTMVGRLSETGGRFYFLRRDGAILAGSLPVKGPAPTPVRPSARIGVVLIKQLIQARVVCLAPRTLPYRLLAVSRSPHPTDVFQPD